MASTSTAEILAEAVVARDTIESVMLELVDMGPQAYQVATRMLGTRSGAGDVVQEAYLRALQQVRPEVTPQQRRVWFLRVTANAARDRLRSEGSRRRREREMRREDPPSGSDAELLGALQVAISSLEQKYRMPICLCYEQRLSQRDAAEVLNMSKSTIAKRIATGIEKLRKAMERAGYVVLPAVVLGGLKQTAPAVPASLAGRIEALVAGGATKGGAGAASASASAAAKGGIAMKIVMGVVAACVMAGSSARKASTSVLSFRPRRLTWKNS